MEIFYMQTLFKETNSNIQVGKKIVQMKLFIPDIIAGGNTNPIELLHRTYS